MTIFTVTVHACSSAGETRSTRVRSNGDPVYGLLKINMLTLGFEEELSTVDKAVAKIYGKGCFFHQSQGLPEGYGQIFRPVKSGGSTSVTGAIRIETSPTK